MATNHANETDEIEKIMSEIEELQKEMAPAPKPAEPSQAAATSASTAEASISGVEEDILREIQASAQTGGASESLEDTLTELKQEEAAGGILSETPPESHQETQSETQEVTMSNSNSNGDGSLSLTLNGTMTLKLKYECEGQEITISFADQALKVQMADGTEFKVPVTRTAQSQNRPTNVKPFKKAV